MKHPRASVLILLLSIIGQAWPQQSQLAEELAKARAQLIKAAAEHRASLEKLLALYEAEIPAKIKEVERRRELYERGIISRLELEQSERELSESQAKVNQVRSRMAEVDDVIAEVRAAEQTDRLGSGRPGEYLATALLIRYSGTARWTISEVGKIESFFASRFKRPLPISTLGQSPTHDRLGYDHSSAVDVALHPDSPEGRALIEYLRSAGIPFTAFRGALPGSSTGAHIHIGRPSHRRAGPIGENR